VWSGHAADAIARARLGQRDATRALALANAAATDALIACSDAKYTYWLLRPSQADPAITLAVGLPNFPAYPSNHACLSAAAGEVLGAVIPADRARFAEIAAEAAESRVHGGIHYRFRLGGRPGDRPQVAALALDVDRRGALRALLP
jgi:hypothetical protein